MAACGIDADSYAMPPPRRSTKTTCSGLQLQDAMCVHSALGTAAWKHVLKPALAKLRLLKAHGVNKKRSRSKGMWGRVTFQDKWAFPREPDQLLFPALRADCNTKHVNNDTACKAVSRLRAAFSIPPKVSVAKHPDSLWPASHGERHEAMRCCGSDGNAVCPDCGPQAA